MKLLNLFSLLLLILFYSCGSYVRESNTAVLNETSLEDYNLSVKILRIEEIIKDNNQIEIEYEISNNSDFLFTKSKKDYYVFFKVLTKEGREIGDYCKIYSKIQPRTSIIEDVKINLSIYNYKEVSAEIFIE